MVINDYLLIGNDGKNCNSGTHKANPDPNMNPTIPTESEPKGVVEKRGVGKKTAYDLKEEAFVLTLQLMLNSCMQRIRNINSKPPHLLGKLT